MAAIVRTGLIVVGLLLMLGGLAVMVAVPAAAVPALEMVLFGAFLAVVVLIERQRYRSSAAERTNAPVGPGGGEPAGTRLEPRFRSTSEAFVDPTTGVRMRVAVDPATGERRYLPEG